MSMALWVLGPVAVRVASGSPHLLQDDLQSHQLRRWYDCYDPSGEGYGAAWLAHKETVLKHTMNVRPATNMETGGWIPKELATPRQSVDLFDCGVEHLSWLERRIGLRDAKGEAKATWDRELLAHLSARAARLEARSREREVKSPHRLSTVAVLPYFSTSPDCSGSGAKCTTGSSAPAMRRNFLNATFWSIHSALTPHVVLSTCSRPDALFALRESGLPFFDVLESDCHLGEGEERFFKPSLLGAHTVTRVQEKLREPHGPWATFHYVYYSEADQVLHVRDARRVIAVVDETHYVSPHRMQPMAHPVDLPSIGTKAGAAWLPRWSRDDLRRIRNVGQYDVVPNVPHGAPHHKCCVGRSQCRGDKLPGNRASWSPWKVETPNLGLVKYDGSLAMIAAHQGNYGALLFRGCDLTEEHNAGLHGCPMRD